MFTYLLYAQICKQLEPRKLGSNEILSNTPTLTACRFYKGAFQIDSFQARTPTKWLLKVSLTASNSLKRVGSLAEALALLYNDVLIPRHGQLLGSTRRPHRELLEDLIHGQSSRSASRMDTRRGWASALKNSALKLPGCCRPVSRFMVLAGSAICASLHMLVTCRQDCQGES